MNDLTNASKKYNSSRGLLIAGGLFDLLGTLATSACVVMLAVLGIAAGVAATHPEEVSTFYQGFTNVMVGVTGVLMSTLIVIVAVVCSIAVIFWIVITVVSFKTASKPIKYAKHSTTTLLIFGIFQFILGVMFMIGAIANIVKTPNDVSSFGIGFGVGAFFLIDAILKFVTTSKLKKEPLPYEPPTQVPLW